MSRIYEPGEVFDGAKLICYILFYIIVSWNDAMPWEQMPWEQLVNM